jgi:hypothetical protein
MSRKLRPGDRVQTKTGRAGTVEWVGRRWFWWFKLVRVQLDHAVLGHRSHVGRRRAWRKC